MVQTTDSSYLRGLLGLARSADPVERKIAYRRLADFPGDDLAIQAVRAGLLDSDADCRKEANVTFTLITRVPPPQLAAAP